MVRTKLFLVWLAWVFCLPAVAVSDPAQGSAPPGATTVIVLRHAEKLAEGSDPGLTEAGRERARALAALLGRTPVDAIYATPYCRTRDTVAPLAALLGIGVRELPLDAARMPEHGRDTAALVHGKHAGGTVVIAGHSNTVPLIVQALGVDPAPGLEESDYGDLFVVTLLENRASLLRLRFGD